jgi:predicted ATPase
MPVRKEKERIINGPMIKQLAASRAALLQKRLPSLASESLPEIITQTLSRPRGARYYRCALQVNTPFQDHFKGFDSNHRRHSPAHQRDYALALAKACKKIGIDAIGVCDHNSVEYVQTVRDVLGQEGIIVFPGFEMASTEGIHLLCLFDAEANIKDLDHLLSVLNLPPKKRWANGEGLAPSQSSLSFPEIIEQVQRKHNGICIAAHVDRENGLLYECAKTTRAQYYTESDILAAQISGRREDLMEFYRKIVNGELEHYRRQKPLALLNCLDVYNLKDLSKPECCTYIKMSSPSLEGLRQAFLDPDSRLRLLSEEAPPPHAELLALAWEGGFLDNGMIHFNENLNCLIGGRGAGKSTVIESLRYVLDLEPIGEEAKRLHEGMLKEVLRSGTHISLLVHSHRPSPYYYLIERTYPQPPIVRDQNGNDLHLHPKEILPGIEIFGQHEIAEIAKDPRQQYQLLQRFRNAEAAELEFKKEELRHRLKTNRVDLLRTQHEIEAIHEKLSRLPGLEEKLRRYKDAGIEAKLKEQSQLAVEEALVKTRRERVPAIKKALDQLRQALAQSVAPFGDGKMDELPNADLWEKMDSAFAAFDEKTQKGLAEIEKAVNQLGTTLLEIAGEWESRRQATFGAYGKMLRDLQKESVDGEAFMKLRRDYEMLSPLKKEARKLEKHHDDLHEERRQLLQEWEEIKNRLFALDEAAAAEISRQLEKDVRAKVAKETNLDPLFDLLTPHVGRHTLPTIRNYLLEKNLISLADFVPHIRDGKEELQEIYGLPAKTAAKLSELSEEIILEMEELDLPNTLYLELNIAEKSQLPAWKSMDDLSTGQKATAILLILLLESDTPLVIDQPEDDLDNRFITEIVIPTLRREKRRRQFLFATHNANLPVLGDAELIVALEASGEATGGAAKILGDHAGSIDLPGVKLQVELILEGGKQAFETRRAKYGF